MNKTDGWQWWAVGEWGDCAWLLRDSAAVSLFEAGHDFGGHTIPALVEGHTHGTVRWTPASWCSTGPTIRCSARCSSTGVRSYPTDMSFSASFDGGRLEYAGSDLNSLFGQRRNLFNAGFWGMLAGILRFNRIAWRAVSGPAPPR